MTRNFDDLFSSWLEDGPTRASDRIVESLRTDVARTPQRRPSFLRRRGGSATIRLSWVAAAVAAVAVAFAVLTVIRPPTPSVGENPPGLASPSPARPSASAPSAAPSPTVLISAELAYEITLPPDWHATSVEAFTHFNPTIIGFIGSSEPPDGVALDDYVRSAVAPTGESSCSSVPVDVEDVSMGGETAFQIVYECNGRAYGLIATGHNGRRYVIGTDAAELGDAERGLRELLPGFRFTD
jgi:hypothetical protein